MSHPISHRLLRFALRVYKCTLSPILAAITGGGCRFTPTCSEYAVQAIEQRGFIQGSWLAIKRICRCQPWGGMGYDPVPARNPPSQHKKSTAHHSGCEHC